MDFLNPHEFGWSRPEISPIRQDYIERFGCEPPEDKDLSAEKKKEFL